MHSSKGVRSVNATSHRASRELEIRVSPDSRAGRYKALLKGEQEPLCVSRQPFLDSARKLLAKGHDPRTMLVMRWAGAKDWALRGSLGVAAKLTIDEHNGTFAKWKPLSRSAVPPRIAKSANKLPKGQVAEQAMPAGTAEKGRRPDPVVQQIGEDAQMYDESALELRPDVEPY
jgi:hypothetical protein